VIDRVDRVDRVDREATLRRSVTARAVVGLYDHFCQEWPASRRGTAV
jgi:hypothetical protein